MRKVVFFLSLLSNGIAFADDSNLTQQRGRSPFTFSEWKGICSNRHCIEDFIILTDGTRLYGSLDKLPSIHYSFGDLEFKVENIAAISLIKDGGNPLKIQYITSDGQNFIGDLGKGKFQIWVTESTKQDSAHRMKKEIDPSIVNFIVLKERSLKMEATHKPLFFLELTNGDHFSAFITDPIIVTDGWEEKSLNPENIIKLCFNGGLHGSVLEGKKIVDLGFHFIKGSSLSLRLPNHKQSLRLKWDQIETIQAPGQGFGSKEDQSFHADRSHSFPDELDEALMNGLQSTAADEIGAHGKLLLEAHGAMSLSPSALRDFELLGMEKLTEPGPLFSALEEPLWVIDISFDDSEEEEEDISKEQAIALDEANYQEILEWLMFEDIQKVDVDPEEFDIAALEDDEDFNKKFPSSTEGGEIEKEDRTNEIFADNSEANLEGSEKEKVETLDKDEQDLLSLFSNEPTWTLEEILNDKDLYTGLDLDEETAAENKENEIAVSSSQMETASQNPETKDEKQPEEARQPEGEEQPEVEKGDQPKADSDLLEADKKSESNDWLWGNAEKENREELTPEELSAFQALIEESDPLIEDMGNKSSWIEGVEQMAYVPEEDLIMLSEAQGDSPQKATFVPTVNKPMLFIKGNAFYIDRYPVSNSEYEDFVAATGHQTPFHWRGGKFPVGQEKRPVVNISYEDAKAYALWTKKRLPTVFEWMRANNSSAITADGHLKEWTATEPEKGKKEVVGQNKMEPISEKAIEYNLGFRTVKDAS